MSEECQFHLDRIEAGMKYAYRLCLAEMLTGGKLYYLAPLLSVSIVLRSCRYCQDLGSDNASAVDMTAQRIPQARDSIAYASYIDALRTLSITWIL